MSAVASEKHGQEVLLIFLGHSSDADALAEAIYDLERELQRVLDEHLSVSANLPFKSVRIWEWRKDGLPFVGGQDKVVAEAIKRANIAVFVFKERIGAVSWDELNQSRNRENPAIPVLAFFPSDSPADLNDEVRIAKWLDLVKKRDELVEDWSAPDSKALRPMEKYKDAPHLATLAVEHLRNAVVSLLKCEQTVKNSVPLVVLPTKFIGDHEHLTYDRQPVLTRSLNELDQDLIKELIAKPLSQDLNADLKHGRDGSSPAVSEQLENLGCLYAGRPTLGALLCFAPAQMLTDKSGCCTLQMAIHDSSERGGVRTPISLARGNLLLLYKKGMSWLTGGTVLRRRGQIGSDTRDDLEIPEIVLREALANALVHRDYESKVLQDQPTRIDVYPDKIEITSYGLLLKEVPIELLNNPDQSLRPFRRNPVIAGIFQCMTLAELNASGIQRMRRVMTSGGLALPLFRTSENFVCVTLARPFELSNSKDPIQSLQTTPRATLNAFISSTRELSEHREAARDACLRARIMPITEEELTYSEKDFASILKQEIDKADLFILILGNRYGYISGCDGTSFTEMEFNYALERGLPILVFTMHQDHPVKINGVELDGEAKNKLEQFKKRAIDGRLCGEFKSAEDLRSQLIQALASLQMDTPAVPRLSSSLHKLPPLPTGFVGRKADLDKLRAMPASGTVLTGLRGMGGIGKTALAVMLAHEWTPRFPEAQLFLDARGTQPDPPSAGALMASVIQTFHPSAKLPEDEAALKAIYHQVLKGKRVLILVDNARDAAQVAPLIPPTDCALIVTSRQSIVLGTTKAHHVGKLTDDEATALLREYHPALGDDDTAALVKLCAGLPLALRLAGAHLGLDASDRDDGQPNVTAYIKTLGSGRLRTLDADAADAGELTISETLRLSEAQLSGTDRAVWRALGVFTASFDDRAAAAVARHSDVETQDTAPAADGKTNPDRAAAKPTGHSNVLDADPDPTSACRATLERLIRRSLLEREGADRYKLHDLAADYARAQLGKAALADLHLAHARHYTAVGDEADNLYLNGNAVVGLALFDRERAQIEAAYITLATRTDEAAARQMIALVNAMRYTGDLRFHPRQRIVWLESQLRAARLVKEKRYEGAALGNLGNAYRQLGDAPKAIEYQEQYLAISRELEDKRGEGNALGNLGIAYRQLGDTPKSIEYYEQALSIMREIRDKRGEGNALGCLGLAHAALGDARKAIEYYEQALAVTREIGDRRGEGNSRGNLGLTYAALGDAPKAIDYHEQYLAIAREIGDQRGEGNALFYSALANDSLGNRAEAIARAEAALRLYEAIEAPAATKVRAQLAEWKCSPEL